MQKITTDAGHDSFLIERDIATYGPLIRERLADSRQLRKDKNSDSASSSQLAPVQLSVAEESILELVPTGSSVLDLGCGEGELLSAIQTRDGDQAGRLMGVEVAQENLLATAMRGIHVID